MWRRNGWKRKQARGTENNFVYQRVGCGVEESFAAKLWRLSGDCWAGRQPSHCQGTVMASSCKILGKEGCTIPKRKDRSWAYVHVQTFENAFVSPRSQ